jgi:hypothetical protein
MTTVDVAPFRPLQSLKYLIILYALTIVSCYLVNAIVTNYPIGPWTGQDIKSSFWLDNVSWQIFAAWWACLFAVVGLWPFKAIENNLARGVVITAVSWGLGWVSAMLIMKIGPGPKGLFPLIGTTWFLLALFSFAGANWLVVDMAPARQFATLLILITGCTFVITHSAIVWIPAWWFPFLLIGLSTGTLTYLTRGMAQPGRAFAILAILFAVVAGCIELSVLAGFWEPEASPISSFWSMGHFQPDNKWLVAFMVATSINYGVPIVTYNWPFSKIAMPWGGLLACAAYLALDVVVAYLLLKLVGSIFSSTEELMTYAYMGVNWSLVLPLIFSVGFKEQYLWSGQKTVGNWDDVD